jgi:hypothetical protein
MNNPFLGLYEVMAEATKVEASFFIAKVKTPLPNLEVQLNDIVLDKEDLLIDKWIKDRNEELFTEYVEDHIHTTSTEVAGETSHSHTISSENKHRHEIKEPIQDKLKANDKVILLKVNDKFIVLSKVVGI